MERKVATNSNIAWNYGQVITWAESGLSWSEGDTVDLLVISQPMVYLGWVDGVVTERWRPVAYFREGDGHLLSPTYDTDGNPIPQNGDGSYKMHKSVRVAVKLSEPAPAGGVTVTISADSTASEHPDSSKVATECKNWDAGRYPNQCGDGDFVITHPTVKIPAGERRGATHVLIIDDQRDDSGETILLEATATGYTLPYPYTIVIVNHESEVPEGGVELPAAENAPPPQKQPIPGKSSNANLGHLSLYLGGGTLEPAFNPDHTEYKAHLTGPVYQGLNRMLMVKARPEHDEATVTVAGQTPHPVHATVRVDRYHFNDPVTIPVVVTAADGATTKTYTLVAQIPPPPAKTYSVSATASAAEGQAAALTITLSEAAPEGADFAVGDAANGGVRFTVTAGYTGSAGSDDVGTITSPVTVPGGSDTLQIAVPTVDDAVDEADETFTVTIAALTEGWEKAADGQDTATVTIIDDDTAGVAITPTTLNVPEDGSNSYTVALWSQPTADVTVTPINSDGGAASVTPASVTFTPLGWNIVQTFTVSGVADSDTDVETVGISHSVASSDGKYAAVPLAAVSVTVTDTTPPPAKTYSVSAMASAAEGGNGALTVTLSEAAPVNGVKLTVTAGYGGSADIDDVGAITSRVIVPAGETGLRIAVPTVDDAVDEADETFTVTIAAVTQGWEKAGDGQDTATVTIVDDDTAGVTIAPATLSLAEDGSATYTVVLDSQPTADVTITPASDDEGAATVSPASLTFAPSGWDQPREFTVSGVADDDRDGESVGVRHQTASDDAGYNGIVLASVAVSVEDTTPAQQQQQEPDPVELPGPVMNLQLAATGDSVTVTWEAPATGGAPGNYIVHLRPEGGGPGSGTTKTPEADKTAVTFRDLEDGATYKVWARAQNEAGKGERVHASVTLPELPGPVVNLLLSATADSVTVSWQAPETGSAPDGYIVHLEPQDGGKGATKRPGAGKTTVVFGDLEAGAGYKVWARAQNEHGKGQRVHGVITLPEAAEEPEPQQQQAAPRTYSLSATASAAEGSSAALTITLSEAAPAEGVEFNVTLDFSGSAEPADAGLSPQVAAVAPGAQTAILAIPTAPDAVDEDDESFTVTVAASSEGWEKEGDGKDTATVTIIDDDTGGVTVTPTTLNVAEDGSASYTVVLDSQPTADVTVSASSGDGVKVSVSPGTNTFTPSEWNTPLTFMVSGLADADTNDESVEISHWITGDDWKYAVVPVAPVSVAVSDTTPPPAQEPEPQEDTGPEPANVQVTPGDGTLTVSWDVSPREGYSIEEIRHALRWSQEPGVWANPPDPEGPGANDGITVAGGVTSYTITGLENGVATGVFVRSFTGSSLSERSEQSSQWVRVKGDHTTPKAAG